MQGDASPRRSLELAEETEPRTICPASARLRLALANDSLPLQDEASSV